MPAKILIVEDELDFRNGLLELLHIESFDAHGVGSLAEYYCWAKNNSYDILIVDRNLPDGDGLEILKSDTKCYGSIVLTCEGRPRDRIEGMNADADYYLVKPFPTDEMLSILRRLDRKMSASSLKLENWFLHSTRWEIMTPNDLRVELTRSEFRLLSCFANKAGAVVSRDELIQGLGFNPEDYDNRRLEVMLRRLRKKIEESGVAKFPLQTVYGVGLAFTETLRVL